MKLLTKAIETKLRANEVIASRTGESGKPVVKFFNPCGAGTWLISDMDEDGVCFGLCDLGMGCPELGTVSIHELQSTRLMFGLGIERDIHWEAKKTLGDYAEEARQLGYIKD
jgi:hypothetical protein